jgi:hypothetical protein
MGIEEIHARNARVEADKAWEVSWTRRMLIAGGTYAVVVFYLTMLGVDRAYLQALVPPCCYLVSTFSLPVFKKLWIQKLYKKARPA